MPKRKRFFSVDVFPQWVMDSVNFWPISLQFQKGQVISVSCCLWIACKVPVLLFFQKNEEIAISWKILKRNHKIQICWKIMEFADPSTILNCFEGKTSTLCRECKQIMYVQHKCLKYCGIFREYLVLLCSLHVVKIGKVLSPLLGLKVELVLPEEFRVKLCEWENFLEVYASRIFVYVSCRVVWRGFVWKEVRGNN